MKLRFESFAQTQSKCLLLLAFPSVSHHFNADAAAVLLPKIFHSDKVSHANPFIGGSKSNFISYFISSLCRLKQLIHYF
jgi:hypothetical protein